MDSRLVCCLMLALALIVGCTATAVPGTEEPMATVSAPGVEEATASATVASRSERTATPERLETTTPIEPRETASPIITGEPEEEETPMNGEVREDLPQVTIAVADLAQRLNVAPETIEVVETRAVIWPDSSLGCPQPDMAYTQVQQDGLLIRLQALGQTYSYHSGGMREPFLCEKGTTAPDAVQDKLTPIPLDELLTRETPDDSEDN